MPADPDDVRAALKFSTSDELPDPGSTPIGPMSKSKGREQLPALGAELDELQQRLWAESRNGGSRSVLLVLQGMDTSGKGGTVRSVLGMVNPQGVRVKAFGKPTRAERSHHYLWRIRKALPQPGEIGVFDRSHYEDVLVPTVQSTLPAADVRKRYPELNAFERELAGAGTTVLKVFLHISPQEQLERLKARLTDRTKWWKYNPSDLDVREQWDDYQRAYRETLRRTSTAGTPWYVVPADRKWYRNWVVANLLLSVLRELDPQFPPPDFDLDAELARVDELAARG